MVILSSILILLIASVCQASTIELEDFSPPDNTYIFQDITFDSQTGNLFGLYRTNENGTAKIMVWNPLGTILDDITLNFAIGLGRGADIAVYDGIIAISDSDLMTGPLFGTVKRYRIDNDLQVPEPTSLAMIVILIGCIIIHKVYK